MAELTHINEQGRAKMVDVSEKADTKRIGVASGRICMQPETFALITDGKIKKGDVLAVAQVAGQLERESPEPAAMFPDVTAVDDQVGNRPGAREADEDALVAPLERHLDVLHVVAHASEVVVLAAERIVVPCVGQVHVLGPVAASLAVAEEPPVAVEVDDFARRQPEARGQQHEENSRFFHVVRFTDKINTKPEKPSSDLVSILLCLRLGIREYAIDGKNIVHTATGIGS